MIDNVWDGIPENPEVEGWHWLGRHGVDDNMFPMYWTNTESDNPENFYWETDDDYICPEKAGKYWKYLGPCLKPEEVFKKIDMALIEADDVVEAFQIELDEMEKEVQKLRQNILELQQTYGQTVHFLSQESSTTDYVSRSILGKTYNV